MRPTILIIESTTNAMQGVARQLRNEPYQVTLQTGITSGTLALGKTTPSAIVIGEALAGPAGETLVEKITNQYPQTSVVILDCGARKTVTNDEDSVWRLENSWHGEELKRILRQAVQQTEQPFFSDHAESRSRKLVLLLQGIVERQRSLLARNMGLEQFSSLAAYKPAAEAMLESLDARVPGLRRQALSEAKLAEFLAGLAGSANLKSSAYLAAALCHSASLFGAPPKAGNLIVQRAESNEAAEAVLQAGFPTEIANAVRHQYENWDGSGPHKVRGEKISVIARCVKAAQYILKHRGQGDLVPTLDLANGHLLDPNLAFRLIGYIRSNQDPFLSKLLGEKQGSRDAMAA